MGDNIVLHPESALGKYNRILVIAELQNNSTHYSPLHKSYGVLVSLMKIRLRSLRNSFTANSLHGGSLRSPKRQRRRDAIWN